MSTRGARAKKTHSPHTQPHTDIRQRGWLAHHFAAIQHYLIRLSAALTNKIHTNPHIHGELLSNVNDLFLHDTIVTDNFLVVESCIEVNFCAAFWDLRSLKDPHQICIKTYAKSLPRTIICVWYVSSGKKSIISTLKSLERHVLLLPH